jgi:hypothetical protein
VKQKRILAADDTACASGVIVEVFEPTCARQAQWLEQCEFGRKKAV